MPNTIAYFTLIIWPLVSLGLFSKLNIVQAFIITTVGGYLILPANFSVDFPFIPAIDKTLIIGLSLLVGCIIKRGKAMSYLPPEGLERKLVLILLLVPIFTTITNQEYVYNGAFWTAGLTAYDSISAVISTYLYLIPLILGLQVLNTQYAQMELFRIITISAIIYSLLILFEIRMSPQLHNWIYGFFPHDFAQQYRDGGFRAVVFLGHGLLVAIFLVISIGCASALWRGGQKFLLGLPVLLIVLFFMVVLFLQKSLGSMILGLIIFTSFALFSYKKVSYLSIILITIVILYPLLSILELFPQQFLLDLTSNIDQNRVQSLQFRFSHENSLLEHAKNKIVFGWGGWGRGLLYGSVPDGRWIISVGRDGLLGFICLFGLGLLSVFRGNSFLKLQIDRQSYELIAIHMLIIAIIMIDQIPNDSLNSFSLMMIGCLLGIRKWKNAASTGS